MDFLIYELTAAALHLGERAKGNLFKPCLRTIPLTAITGALRRHFGTVDQEQGGVGIKAVGFLDAALNRNRVEILTYSPRDRVREVSKIPLQVEFLTDVLATVLVVASDAASRLPERFELTLGGLRSHGFGRAHLRFLEKQPAGSPRPGVLRVRLPEEETTTFGIVRVQAPVYGYLFKPTPGAHPGLYVRSLFEGSQVVGPKLLLYPKQE